LVAQTGLHGRFDVNFYNLAAVGPETEHLLEIAVTEPVILLSGGELYVVPRLVVTETFSEFFDEDVHPRVVQHLF